MTPQSARAVFQEKLNHLCASDIADADFSDVVYESVTAFALDEQSFRDAFGLTAGAVERWMQGKNLPQPQVRATILRWISAQLGQVH